MPPAQNTYKVLVFDNFVPFATIFVQEGYAPL